MTESHKKFSEQVRTRRRHLGEHQMLPAQQPHSSALLFVAQQSGLGIEDLLSVREGDPESRPATWSVAHDDRLAFELLYHHRWIIWIEAR